MSVNLVLTCDGCDAEPVSVGPLSWDLGTARVEDVEDLVPNGWVMFDPWTYCTYCPACWAAIQESSSPVMGWWLEGLREGPLGGKEH